MAGRTAAKNAAYCAVACALLIAGQIALGAVSGVEIVTVLLLTFSAYFGCVCGVATAVSFSLLRCFIWGFNPAVIILYLIYYPTFAFVFGLLGKTGDSPTAIKLIAVNLVFISLGILSAVAAALNLIKISAAYKGAITVLLWVISGICWGQLIAYNALFAAVRIKGLDARIITLFIMSAAACAFTAAFTLLDDIITPLIYGMDEVAALGYFYASFIAMLPQIICAAATTLLLYFPLTSAYAKACPGAKCIDKRVKKL